MSVISITPKISLYCKYTTNSNCTELVQEIMVNSGIHLTLTLTLTYLHLTHLKAVIAVCIKCE